MIYKILMASQRARERGNDKIKVATKRVDEVRYPENALGHNRAHSLKNAPDHNYKVATNEGTRAIKGFLRS